MVAPATPVSPKQSGERAANEFACQHHSFTHEETATFMNVYAPNQFQNP